MLDKKWYKHYKSQHDIENLLLVLKCMNKVEEIPCVGHSMRKFRILISLFEPKRSSPLSPHCFFKVLDSIKLVEGGHLRENSSEESCRVS